MAQFQGKYRYAQTEDAAKQKLYKMLTGAEESKPKTITVSKLLDEYITAATPNLKSRTVKNIEARKRADERPRLRVRDLSLGTLRPPTPYPPHAGKN